jgi:hypothetical protein
MLQPLRIRPSGLFQFRINFWNYEVYSLLVGLLGPGITSSQWCIGGQRKQRKPDVYRIANRTYPSSIRAVENIMHLSLHTKSPKNVLLCRHLSYVFSVHISYKQRNIRAVVFCAMTPCSMKGTEEISTSIFSEDRGSILLRNIRTRLPDKTVT